MTLTGSAALVGAAEAAVELAGAVLLAGVTSALPHALVSTMVSAVIARTEVLMFTDFIDLFLSLF
ncbi:hypothetical protein PAENIP36_62980 [Paenibacillus sp. P36]